MLESFYFKSPFFIKCILASLKGAYLRKLRYDSTSLLRIEKYLERETWNRKQWQEWIDSRLNKVLHNARNHVPFYQEYWSKSNKSYDCLENWPILTKQKINESPDLFIDTRFAKSRLYHDHTSGTTGTPMDIYLDYDSVKEQYALFEARVKRKYHIELDETWAIIGAQRVTDVKRKTPPYWVYNNASNQLYLSSLHIVEWSVNDYVKALQTYQPKCIIAYTNSIYELAKCMLSNNLNFKMKAVITNAEPLFKYQEDAIKEAFECPVVETYGQAELVSFASKFPDGKMYESPEMGITEIVDIDEYEDDQYGRLIATGILNKAMPLIRYDTNDLISTTQFHEDGFLPQYGKILGRKDDIIILEDGRKIVQIDGIFTSDLNIKKAQIIQYDFSKFKIKVVPGTKWDRSKKDIIKQRLYKRLGKVNIEIEICSVINSNWAGKFRIIKSHLNQDIIN